MKSIRVVSRPESVGWCLSAITNMGKCIGSHTTGRNVDVMIIEVVVAKPQFISGHVVRVGYGLGALKHGYDRLFTTLIKIQVGFVGTSTALTRY